ncbi:HAMP domain-containing protein, partial [bacterium]|nr:HAMP domain-containing protein [bacterium]
DARLAALRASAIAHVTLYDAQGQMLTTSFDLNETPLTALQLDALIRAQVQSAGAPVEAAAQIATTPYRALYMPLVMGGSTPLTVGVLLPDRLPFATELGRQMASLFAAALAGTAVVAVFAVMSRVTRRVEHVTKAAEAIAQGRMETRTAMPPRDEVGRLGAALDSLATTIQAREDKFRTLLRRERRERTYILSILESMPDGVLVYDKEGRFDPDESARPCPFRRGCLPIAPSIFNLWRMLCLAHRLRPACMRWAIRARCSTAARF